VSRRSGKQPLYKKAVFWVALCIPALLLLYGALLYFTLPASSGKEVTITEFSKLDGTSGISIAVLRNEDLRLEYLQNGRQYWVALPSKSTVFPDTFLQSTLKRGISVKVDQQAFKQLVQPAIVVVPTLIIAATFVLVFLLMRSGGSSTFLNAAARKGAASRPLTFADVAGADEAVIEAREVRDYLLDPKKFAGVGAEAPRGLLLVGPPGTGKTLLARAVAGEAGVPFFSMSGADFVEMYVGVGAARVRDLFRQVRERAPAILFIDELDAMGRTRADGGSGAIGQDERDQTLNQLLVELDGFDRDTGVVLIGATNRPDVLDPALLRRGRFDRQIVVDRPDRLGRLAILEVHGRSKTLAPSVDFGRLATETPGFTGADLASVLNEAALLTVRRGRGAIEQEDLEEAVERIMQGSEGRTQLLTPADKQSVAYHESGHALLALALPGSGSVRRVSIVGRGHSVGSTQTLPQEGKVVITQVELEQELAYIMGGRAADELVAGQATTSSKDDLRRATDLARRMVCELGMSEGLGRRALGRPVAGHFLGDDRIDPDYSAEMASAIDGQISRLVDEGFERASRVLSLNRSVLDEVAELLVRRETLREQDLAPFTDKIRRPRPQSETGSRRAAGSVAPAPAPAPTVT